MSTSNDAYEVLKNAVIEYLDEFAFYDRSGEPPQWPGYLEELVGWVEPPEEDIYEDDEDIDE